MKVYPIISVIRERENEENYVFFPFTHKKIGHSQKLETSLRQNKRALLHTTCDTHCPMLLSDSLTLMDFFKKDCMEDRLFSGYKLQ